ncbi:MAG: pseudouridine synthase, partial [Actinomycetes bacterium]
MTERIVVAEEHAGSRADAGLAGILGVSRSVAASLLAEGNVLSRGRPLGKSAKLVAGDVLDVTVPERRDPLEVVEEVVEGLDILLDDDDFVVVNKPVGVAAHPSPGWVGPTVVGGLAAAGYRISTSGAPERAGIVHRLDVGTSGVMVVAKSERAYTALKRAFKERTVDKVYHAVVQGLPDPLTGTIDAPIGRHPGHDWRFAVIEDGRPSVTHYEVLEA